ncbi:ADP-ribosylation factor-like protein 2 [Plasmodiophora brassicae]|uniref:ADP-ribosylation factor-like protein 2 n=1 Tax=Plasmodiophora brassicae TaxID=37360 RepID=A0A0G4ITL1_PLABS|nr:hypothetical protein PBRA_006747 [Plasmodiophora brassicae]SPR00769.1 unnamed protein product [Plasmodiophora brassicae]
MGLLGVLRKIKRKEKQMRILMLGLDNAGKTTVVKQFSGEDVNEISPTLGFQISTFDYRGYSLNIWDVGGQTTIRSYWRNYFERTDGLIWVVDSADIRRLKECRAHLHDVLREERLEGASLLVLANKQDLDGSLTCEEIGRVLQLDKIVSHHWQIVAVSAITGDGLVDAMNWLVEDVSNRIFMLE